MRFDKETRTKVHEANPNAVTIRWPAGAGQPEKGRVYWLQSAEELERENERLYTCAEVMAAMRKAPIKKKRRRRSRNRPTKADPCILVEEVTILKRGWEVTVRLHHPAEPEPHLRLPTKVQGGLDPVSGSYVPTELEPQRMDPVPSRSEREDAERALKIEHKASVDDAAIGESERKLQDQRRRGKSGKLAQAALERSKRRAALASAEIAA
jgi:hypothetical protein